MNQCVKIQGEWLKPTTGCIKKIHPFQIQIIHNLLKYRISLSYFVTGVENLVRGKPCVLRNYYRKVMARSLIFFDTPCMYQEDGEVSFMYNAGSTVDFMTPEKPDLAKREREGGGILQEWD